MRLVAAVLCLCTHLSFVAAAGSYDEDGMAFPVEPGCCDTVQADLVEAAMRAALSWTPDRPMTPYNTVNMYHVACGRDTAGHPVDACEEFLARFADDPVSVTAYSAAWRTNKERWLPTRIHGTGGILVTVSRMRQRPDGSYEVSLSISSTTRHPIATIIVLVRRDGVEWSARVVERILMP